VKDERFQLWNVLLLLALKIEKKLLEFVSCLFVQTAVGGLCPEVLCTKHPLISHSLPVSFYSRNRLESSLLNELTTVSPPWHT